MSQEDDTYTEIFSALKHPIRRRILKMLEIENSTYTTLLNGLGIDTGLLNYHLENLGSLIGKTEEGKYRISEFGHAALKLTKNIEDPIKTQNNKFKILGFEFTKPRLLAILVIILVSTNLYSLYQYESIDRSYVIAVDCDSFDPYVLRIAEIDINQYCEDNELIQRFDFIPIQNPIEGPHPSATETFNRVINSDYSLLIGPFHYETPVETVQAFEENNLFMINPNKQTSRLDYQSDRSYAIMADVPETEILIEAILSYNIETIILITSDSLNGLTRGQKAQELYESKGGSVYSHIVLPHSSSLSQNADENYNFAETLDEINTAVKSAITEYGEAKVGVLLFSLHVPVLLYQSKEMDSIQDVSWFTYGYSRMEWADKYAAKVNIIVFLEVMVDTEKVADIERIANRDYKASLPSFISSEIESQMIGAQHATLYDACWLMALSVLEAGSANPSEVSTVFREVAADYDGIYGNYSLDEAGDRCDFKVSLAKIAQDGSEYVSEVCGLYDVATGELETFSNFP